MKNKKKTIIKVLIIVAIIAAIMFTIHMSGHYLIPAIKEMHGIG